jgi:hypothetical protein
MSIVISNLYKISTLLFFLAQNIKYLKLRFCTLVVVDI